MSTTSDGCDFERVSSALTSHSQKAPLNSGGPNPGQLDSVSIVSSAMERQLGLKLEASKIPVDMLVIDPAEKTPTPN
jgi:uncharacterized protein (TIGR03435 family)